MSQNLPAPCYQVYAANRLASLPFRQADLATRGLISTMEMECWVNLRLPSDPVALAKVLGFNAEEITACLPAAILFFSIDENGIFSPQLEDYRAHLNEIRDKQRAGGKIGANITNRKRKHSKKQADTEHENNTGNSQVHTQVEARVPNIEKQRTVNQSQTQSLKNSLSSDPFVAAYEAAEVDEHAHSQVGR